MIKRMYLNYLFVLSVIVLAGIVMLRIEASKPGAEAEPSDDGQAQTETITAAAPDAETSFTALSGGEVTQQSMDGYLVGVLAGEMPASFSIEALKAQAVAARTYILYKTLHETPAHPEADVCDKPSCCKAHLTDDELREKWGEDYEKLREKLAWAVTSTDSQYLSYSGEPIQAVFHSSSDGFTESSAAIWGETPYLVSVSSPESEETVPNFISTVEVTAEDFKNTLLSEYPEAAFSDSPESWLEGFTTSESGRVASAQVAGVTLTGNEMRMLFTLRSAAFTLEYTESGTFLFTVRGFGHGVGMSQYGANVLAARGMSYNEILAHYYPGTELVAVSEPAAG